ncbi:NAD-dependent epimerase/dehydratase family protein [Helicobacter suis]|uniref:NAD-dependent epimerase/dehydratase family protein n=1 Tax=Helicobacter suis TaxID=104628 RepID=UPI0013D2E73C|nr:NAD(P)-dependent oxidoreductase [Helicobacter suis]
MLGKKELSDKTIFLAGASGVIGYPLAKMLVGAGYPVFGTTRFTTKVDKLIAIGVKPVVVDVFDTDTLEQAIMAIQPEIVIHQLTDLPDGLPADKMPEALVRNARIRDEGTHNLVRAAQKASVKKFLAQSIAFVYAPSNQPHTEESPLLDFNDPVYGQTAQAVDSLEQQVLNGKFNTAIILRNGWLYGADSGYKAPVEFAPSLHVDAAVFAAFLATQSDKSGIYNVADQDKRLDTSKFCNTFPEWSAQFCLPTK